MATDLPYRTNYLAVTCQHVPVKYTISMCYHLPYEGVTIDTGAAGVETEVMSIVAVDYHDLLTEVNN